MLGLISIIVNGCDNTGFSAKQGNCFMGGEMPHGTKNSPRLHAALKGAAADVKRTYCIDLIGIMWSHL